MPYPRLDANQIKVDPLDQRESQIQIVAQAVDPQDPLPAAGPLIGQITRLADRVFEARQRGASVMLAYGAHLIKNGGGLLLRELVRLGYVTHLATQGAGIIHDWEFGFLGRSSESVRENTPHGAFGTWDETGRYINLAALVGTAAGRGLGESVCRLVGDERLEVPTPDTLAEQIRRQPGHTLTAARADLLHAIERHGVDPGRMAVPHPFKRYTVLDACHEHRVPLTVHPGIGYDIITNHPMFHGGALGRGAGTDTRIFAHGVQHLSGGVYLSVGSAIMSPQVFEKALSVANNLLLQGDKRVTDFDIAVVDLQDGGGWDWSRGEPPKEHPAYYLRFCKTFHRMGGRLDYLCADNRVVLANLLALLRERGASPATSE